jgi:predicted MPP superfamily phosphohydrolase
MEEIEITSWITLEAIQNAAEVVDSVGDLQSGHKKAVFCVIEEDFLELGYLDTASNYLRRYENKEEFELALEKLKEEEGEVAYNDNHNFDEDFRDEENMEDLAAEEESEGI